ncbi:hypothetical protein ACWDA3_57180 [Nonomuraea rubra]
MNHLTNLLASLPPSSAPTTELNTTGLADFLRAFFGPLFLVTVSVVALFFLFAREITRVVQFLVVAVVIGVIFYVPNIIETLARGMAAALGVT